MTDGHINQYDYGDVVVSSVEFRDPTTNALTDPAGVEIRILLPGVQPALVFVFGVDPEVVKDAVGQYHMNITANREGRWSVRWAGLGALAASDVDYFMVCDSPFF
jgi:hypothetical protein